MKRWMGKANVERGTLGGEREDVRRERGDRIERGWDEGWIGRNLEDRKREERRGMRDRGEMRRGYGKHSR